MGIRLFLNKLWTQNIPFQIVNNHSIMSAGINVNDDDKQSNIFHETNSSSLLLDHLSSGRPDIAAILNICSNESSCCQLLLRDGSTLLHVACKNTKILSHPKVILSVLNAYPLAISSPNEFGFLPLHKAVSVASAEHIPSLKILIDHYPQSLMSQTRDGQGVLHLAITGPRMPSPDVIEFLCQKEPMVACITDAYGQLPLHKAAAKPRIDIDTIQILFQNNPHALTLKDNKGYFSIVIYFHYLHLCAFLFSFCFLCRMLPLHWIVCRGNPNIDVLLLIVEEYREGLLELDYEGLSPLVRYVMCMNFICGYNLTFNLYNLVC